METVKWEKGRKAHEQWRSEQAARINIESFEDLRVYQKVISLVKRSYEITCRGRLSKDFGLRDQLQFQRLCAGLVVCCPPSGGFSPLLACAQNVADLTPA